MPLTTSQPEVIEIPDSPTAQPEAIVISDDEVTELVDYRGKLSICPIHFSPAQRPDRVLAKQINFPRIPPAQPLAFEPEGDDRQESMNLALVDVKSSSDGPMASPGRVVSFQSFSPGEFKFGVGIGRMI